MLTLFDNVQTQNLLRITECRKYTLDFDNVNQQQQIKLHGYVGLVPIIVLSAFNNIGRKES